MGQPLRPNTLDRLISKDSFERSELDDPALQADHGRMCSIVGA
jgi:hypothetical protein